MDLELGTDSIFLRLENLYKTVDERINREKEQLEVCKKNSELELKMAQELKVNRELSERLESMVQRSSELDRVCASFQNKLTITDSDQHRLDHAKEMYQIGKELTGIRFDFSAPPNVAKGYIKNESLKLLEVFEIDTSPGSGSGAGPGSGCEALWALLYNNTTPALLAALQNDKENIPQALNK